jgi:ribosomal protein S7
MSDTAQVVVEDVKVQVETAAVKVVEAVVPDALKVQLEAIVKAAIKELLEEIKKGPLATLDKNGDGVVTATEVKEVAVAAAKKWCF